MTTSPTMTTHPTTTTAPPLSQPLPDVGVQAGHTAREAAPPYRRPWSIPTDPPAV